MFSRFSYWLPQAVTQRFLGAGLLLLMSVPAAVADGRDEGRDHDQDKQTSILIEQALRAEIDGKFAERDELLNEAARSNKDLGDANWYLGRTLDEQGNWHDVSEVVEKASTNQMLGEYERFRANLSDNESDNWILANWCATNQLSIQCRAHLEKTLKLNPKHQGARLALGHQMIGGEWVTPKEIATLQRRSEMASAGIQKYGKKIDSLMNRISRTGPRGRIAAGKMLDEINDPNAISVVESLGSAYSIHTSEAAIEWLGKVDDPEASRSLARFAIFHPTDSIRKSATIALKRKPVYDFVPEILGMLQGNVQVMTVPSFDGRGRLLGYRQAFAQEKMDEREMIVIDRTMTPVNRPNSAVGNLRSGNVVRNQLTDQERFNNTSMYRMANKAFKKEMEDLHQEAIENANRLNALTEQRNARIADVLSEIAEQNFVSNVNEVWRWWDNYNESYSQDYKPERYDYTSLEYRVPQTSEGTTNRRTPTGMSAECFIAGTPVVTIRGLRPIETITVGDIVLSRDVPTGALQWQPVLTSTTRPPDSTFELSFEDESLTCTPGHLLWVSGKGWKKARDIKAGDVLHGACKPVVVKQNFETAVHPTFNLEVADNGTYFVGRNMILSHDVTPRRGSREIVPGLRGLTEGEKMVSENLPLLNEWVVVWK